MELFKLLGTIAVENQEANSDIEETVGKASDAEGKMSSAFKKISGVIATAFAVDKIKDFGLNCVNAAADASAMTSQFSQVFGDLEGQASANLTAIAQNTGIVENRLKGSYTQIAAFAKTGGMETADALSLADRAMIAVADSAAFYDRSLEETTESLQSFLKGNYENDAALGLSCTETTRNAAANELYGKSFNELSEAQKQLTLLQMVEDANELSGALGQAARESDTWTNQTGNLKQAWTDFQAVIGERFLPIAVSVVTKMQELCVWMTQNQGIVIALAAVVGTLAGAVGLYNAVQAIKTAMNAAEATSLGALIAAKLADVAATMAMLAPYALVVAAIAAVIAIIVVCIKHWDKIKEKASEVAKKIKNTWEVFKNDMAKLMNDLMNKIKETWDNIKSAVVEKCSAIYSAASEKFQAMKSAIEEKVNAAKQVVFNVFSNIQDTISQKVETAKTTVSNVFSTIQSTISEKVNSAKATVSNVFSSIKSEIQDKINAARDAVKSAIDRIKGFFNFSWSLPRLKLPHISISGKFSLNPPSVPKFGISWYQKAMENAMILDSPTIFGYSQASGKFLGGGEAGNEVVAGQNTLMNLISSAVAERDAGLLAVLERILAAILNLDEGMLDSIKKGVMDGMDGTKLSVNEREFARLVRTVN